MAENETPETPTEEKAKPAKASSSGLVKFLIGVTFVVVLLTVVFFSTWYFTKMWNTEGSLVKPGIDPERIESEKAPAEIFDMGQFTVVIFDESGRSFNLRVYVKLGIGKERPELVQVKEELTARKDQLTDAIYDVLVGMEPKNFMGTSTERSEGMAELKASIIRAVNSRMKQKIDACFFTEFIFQ
jgi:flagellar basal body-associated protein FliL